MRLKIFLTLHIMPVTIVGRLSFVQTQEAVLDEFQNASFQSRNSPSVCLALKSECRASALLP